jgi:protoporphyrinogen oxidase
MPKPHVVILGAGPAGLGAAYRLTRDERAQVTVLERNPVVGGNAGSFPLAGMSVDYGSHRLHPACDARVLADIRALLGDDLLDRPRHGRIRLQKRWIHFPLKPLDLLIHLSPAFTFGFIGDAASKLLPRKQDAAAEANFASVLEQSLGKTICREFYFPYARKLWGLEPQELAPEQGKRRVGANSLGKMLSKVLASAPGFKRQGAGRFFYPRRGYGQISEAYHFAARAAGASFVLGAPVDAVETERGAVTGVRYLRDGKVEHIAAEHVWSTIPLTVLANLLTPPPPPELLAAARALDYRAMILIYAVLGQAQFSEYDAHYFPETEIPISRLSEPKNYSGAKGPRDRTVLCAELPCSPDDAVWSMSDRELGELLCHALQRAEMPIRAPVRQVVTRRLRYAYPIYRRGYEDAFRALDRFVDGIDGLLTFGRQGLFAHDNTHHALYMAYAAADCLDAAGRLDREGWAQARRVFETHVVED